MTVLSDNVTSMFMLSSLATPGEQE